MRIHFPVVRYPLWLAWLIGVPLIVTLVFLVISFFIFSLFFFGIAALIFGARVAWRRRRSRKILDGEYTLVKQD